MRVALLPLLLVVLFAFAPISVQAATFFGPIVPPECNCEEVDMGNGIVIPSAPDWGCVMQTVQNVMNFAVSFSVIIIILAIVYAGAMFMLSAGNPHNRESARKMIGNAIIGTLVVMSAWLVVDFLMKVLYDNENANFGPWNEILAPGSAPRCFHTAATPPPLPTISEVFRGNWGDGELARGTGTGACDPARVQQGAAAGGHTITNSQANTLACIARFESTCGARNLNYRWGRGSSAAGAFQVLLAGNSQAYENPACYRAAGVSGPLNCSEGFRNGNPIRGSAIVERCVRAAANLDCSASAAAYVMRTQGFRAWIADPNSARQRQCISGQR